jgi:hypothetical protein
MIMLRAVSRLEDAPKLCPNMDRLTSGHGRTKGGSFGAYIAPRYRFVIPSVVEEAGKLLTFAMCRGALQ